MLFVAASLSRKLIQEKGATIDGRTHSLAQERYHPPLAQKDTPCSCAKHEQKERSKKYVTHLPNLFQNSYKVYFTLKKSIYTEADFYLTIFFQLPALPPTPPLQHLSRFLPHPTPLLWPKKVPLPSPEMGGLRPSMGATTIKQEEGEAEGEIYSRQ